MCGICGITSISKEPASQDLLQQMARTMRHRGPDDEGYVVRPGMAFGFQRLSIIDLQGGHQPMSIADGSLWIAFNGEIYNYQTLREKLEATGRHVFQTKSDTEVILHLYQEYKEKCVDHLRGMFAFAIWDQKEETLFIARDRFGKKPLVYCELPGSFLFASESRALLKHPAVRKELHYPAIDMYLTYQYIPSPDTVYQSIRKLKPAHWAKWRKGNLTIQRYWEPLFSPKTTLSFEEASEQMMQTLREATRLRMIADVPLGAFLSGGKDSSAVVGIMSELSKTPIKTFSIGFEEDTFSELPFARMVAQRFNCDHHEFVVKPNAIELLPKLAWHYGEPYADSSALPSYYVSQMTRQHVTVALNGDGGDESFAGYARYQAMKLMTIMTRLPMPLREAFYKFAAFLPDGIPPFSFTWRLKRFLSLGLRDSGRVYLDTLSFFKEEEKEWLYGDVLRQTLSTHSAPQYLDSILQHAPKESGVDTFLYADMLSYLPECLNVKMDIASMANSLETRSPLMDHELVNLVAKFPVEWKLRGLHGSKYIFDQKLRGWLPNEILNRPKQGFSLPMGRWFRGPLKSYVRDILLSDQALRRGLFKKEGLERIIHENEFGKRNYSYHLWALLMLEHWYRAYID